MCQETVGLRRYRSAHVAVGGAELPPSTARVAHALLACADLNTGQVNMTWEELASVTGCENVNAARRHLGRMQGSKLIHYSTNDYVYVTWLAWLRDGANDGDGMAGGQSNDVDVARSRADSSAPTRQLDKEVDQESELFGEADAPVVARRRAARRAGALAVARGRAGQSHARGLFVSQSTNQLQGKGEQTNKPTAAIASTEQARSVALLMDGEVGLSLGVAWELAARHRFEELVRQVMSWRRQMAAGMVSDSGALVHRIRQGFGATVTDADRVSGLYRRHCGDEVEVEQRRSYRLELQ